MVTIEKSTVGISLKKLGYLFEIAGSLVGSFILKYLSVRIVDYLLVCLVLVYVYAWFYVPHCLSEPRNVSRIFMLSKYRSVRENLLPELTG